MRSVLPAQLNFSKIKNNCRAYTSVAYAPSKVVYLELHVGFVKVAYLFFQRFFSKALFFCADKLGRLLRNQFFLVLAASY